MLLGVMLQGEHELLITSDDSNRRGTAICGGATCQRLWRRSRTETPNSRTRVEDIVSYQQRRRSRNRIVQRRSGHDWKGDAQVGAPLTFLKRVSRLLIRQWLEPASQSANLGVVIAILILHRVHRRLVLLPGGFTATLLTGIVAFPYGSPAGSILCYRCRVVPLYSLVPTSPERMPPMSMPEKKAAAASHWRASCRSF